MQQHLNAVKYNLRKNITNSNKSDSITKSTFKRANPRAHGKKS